MDFTGERYLPAVGGEIRQEHLHRYAYASAYVQGRDVLDMACGEGYGSDLLAEHAQRVWGVDIAPEAVAHARQAYAHRTNLEFLDGSATALPLQAGSVDVIVSFETIEHLAEHEAMMLEFARVLRPDGLLILSSPNKAVYSDESNYHNAFHVRELYFDELDALVRGHFQRVAYLGQRFATGSAIYPLQSRRGDARLQTWTDDGQSLSPRLPALQSPMYFLLLATNAAALPQPRPSILLSEQDDLYLDFRKTAHWASGVHDELLAVQDAGRKAEAALREQLAQAQVEHEEAQAGATAAHAEQTHQLELKLGDARQALHETELRAASQAEQAGTALQALERQLREAQDAQEASHQALLEAQQAVLREQASVLAQQQAHEDTRQALAQAQQAGADLRQQMLEAAREHEAAAQALRLALQAAQQSLRDAQAQAAAREQDHVRAQAAAAERLVQLQHEERVRQDAVRAAGEARASDLELQQRALTSELAQVRQRAAAEAADASAAAKVLMARLESAAMEAQASGADALERERALQQRLQEAAAEQARQLAHAAAALQAERAQATAAVQAERAQAAAAVQAERMQAAAAHTALRAELQAAQRQAAAAELALRQRLEALRSEVLELQRLGENMRLDAATLRREREALRAEVRQRDEAAIALQAAHEAAQAASGQRLVLLQQQAADELRAALLATREQHTLALAEAGQRLQAAHEAGRARAQEIHAQWRAQLAQSHRDARRRARDTRDTRLAEHAAAQLAWQQHTTAEAAQARQREQALVRSAHERDLAWARQRAEAERAHAARVGDLLERIAGLQEALRTAELAASERVADHERQRRREAADAAAQAQRQAALLQERAQLAAQLGQGVLELSESPSWRITAPLRMLSPRLGVGTPQAALRRLAVQALFTPADATLGAARHGVAHVHPTITETTMKFPLTDGAVPTIDELLELEDHEFVQAAYWLLLGRPADEHGRQHYLAALQQGGSRLQMLSDLRFSDEGRERPVPVPGFDAAMRRLRLSRLPVLGRLVKAGPRAPTVLSVRRSIQGLAAEVQQGDGQLQLRLTGIEQSLQVGVGGLAQHMMASEARLEQRMNGVEQALQQLLQTLGGQLGDAHGRLDAHLADIGAGMRASTERLTGQIELTEQRLAGQVGAAAQQLAAHAAGTERLLADQAAQLERRIGEHAAATDDQVARHAALLQQRLGESAASANHDLAQHAAALDQRVAAQGLVTNECLALHAAALDQHLSVRFGESERAQAEARRHTQLQALAGPLLQALAEFRWSPDTDLWTAVQHMLEGDDSRYFSELFVLAMERVPHDYELDHFVDMLRRGSSRLLVAQRLLAAPEFLHRHERVVPVVTPATPAAAPQPAVSLQALAPALPSIPIHAQPSVSVVIPIYGKIDYTLRCLRSIAAHPPTVPFEVIVVDDCSPDESLQVLRGVSGIRLVANEQNQGFIRSCNRGAALARGAYLCMLNNDTEVAPGWLDELVRTFDTFPGTGLVGSKLLFPDGKLQEAGGILWKDGSAWNFGRGQDPSLPGFNYVREVDYCSGASIMLPADLWKRLGGFDEHYLPAYCEDSDLALKVRAAGLRVLYQPLSAVIHHEGISSGTDTTQGVKAYQVVNTTKLYARWAAHLAHHQPNGVDVDRAKDRMALRRVLVIDICTPTPNQDAGSVTVVNFLHLLREMRFQVTFVAEDNFLYMPDYTPPLQRAGIEVLYAPFNTSVEAHLQECGARYDLVLLWRPAVVEKHLPAVRRLAPQAKVVYHTVDLHYLRMEREAELRSDPQGMQAAAEMKRRELWAVQAVDSAIVHSTHELDVLKEEVPVDNLFVFPLIMDVPGSTVPWSSRAGVCFVGGYQHPPNVDAVRWFVAEVMPLLRQRLPGTRFHVIGSKPPPAVLELGCDDVVIEGFVEELQPLFDTLRVSVAPLRYGAGVKGKVGNSMAMGVPVVATTVAVEGMGLADRHDVLIADGPSGLADAICELYRDETLWKQLQAAGIRSVENNWGGTASYRTLQRLLAGVGLDVAEPLHPLRLYRDGRA